MSTPLATLILAAANVELLALPVVAAAATVSVLVKTLTGRPLARRTRATRRRAATPSPFSYWYALGPFEDHTGAKERPVLVLRLDGSSARVLKVTSKARPGRTNYRRVATSGWDRSGHERAVGCRPTGVMTIPLAGFRRRLGDERNVYVKRDLVRIHPDELRRSIANPSGEPQL